jgi:ABC-type transport system involved in multi-copper enzyme maturation permease subunit
VNAVKLRRVGLVAWHVFKESIRDRVLYAIAGFAVLLVIASLLIGQLTAGQDLKIIKDLGLVAIELAGVLMAVFIGVGLVSREIERRSIHSLLAKPLLRAELVIGKYLGLVLTLVVNVAGMALAFYAVLAWLAWTSPDEVRLSWDAPAADPRLLISLLLIICELALLTAIALFFSTFASSALMSIAFTLGLFVAGLSSPELRHFGDAAPDSALTTMVATVGWIVPAFSMFDYKNDVVHGIAWPMARVGASMAYAAAYITALLAGAVLLFSRREFR